MAIFDSTKTRLAELLKQIEQGKLQLPDFQRGWVWDDEHIRSLLASVAREFPIGAVMLLETGGEARFKMRPVEGVDVNIADKDVERLILDGQQRLTSLTQVLSLHKPVETKDSKKRLVKRFYFFDIEKAIEGPQSYEEAVVAVDENKQGLGRLARGLDVSTREAEYQQFLFPCSQILNSDEWEEGLFEAVPGDRYRQFMDFRKTVLSAFRNYDIPVIELKKHNKKEAVCLVFEKVNTGGVPLSVFELVTATYAADGVNMRDEWFGLADDPAKGILPRLKREPLLRDIEATDFLQGLSLLHTYDKRLKDIAEGKTGKNVAAVSAKRESVLALPLEAYQSRKEGLLKGFLTAAKFLRREAFFAKKDLPYRTQVIPLACVLSLLGDRWLEQVTYDKLARWYWSGVLGELYGGAVETRIANDLQQLMSWIKEDEELPFTVNEANFQPGRLDTLRSRNSAAYKGISVLIQRGGAKDWYWKTTIRDLDGTDWEEAKLDIHHIFPQDWCKKNGILPRSFNSILNKTPISYKANRMIGGKAPSQYLEQLQSDKAVKVDAEGLDKLLETHCLDSSFLRADDYDGFRESRRKLMLALVEAAMGKPPENTGEEIADDDIDEA